MIFVTGTRRSGTSMWMQVLQAAGFPVIGELFPRDWSETLREANPGGFWESNLRHGVYYRTNPDPHTGQYLIADQVKWHVVKVFIPGLVRSDRGYIERVVATLRPWREYEASVKRLYALEDAARASAKMAERTPPPRMPPALEWWDENYTLVRDVALRQYPCHVQSYDGMLRDPRSVLERTLEWLGSTGDLDAAVAAVEPSRRNFRSPDSDSVPPHVARVFDDLYESVDAWKELDRSLIERLARTHEELAPQIREHRERIARALGRAPEPESPLADDGPFRTLD